MFFLLRRKRMAQGVISSLHCGFFRLNTLNSFSLYLGVLSPTMFFQIDAITLLELLKTNFICPQCLRLLFFFTGFQIKWLRSMEWTELPGFNITPFKIWTGLQNITGDRETRKACEVNEALWLVEYNGYQEVWKQKVFSIHTEINSKLFLNTDLSHLW